MKTNSLVASVNLRGNVKGEKNKSYNTYLGVAPATLRTEGPSSTSDLGLNTSWSEKKRGMRRVSYNILTTRFQASQVTERAD